jgi:Nucleotidyl transferase AbiEii toxin, Type IV TA system
LKTKKPVDVSASVRQRLLNRAKARSEDYNFTLSQFAIERFLYRLGVSAHKRRFVLKGASLFCLWSDEPHRATWDLDLLGKGGGTVPEIETAMRDICATPVDDDGISFDPASVAGEPIRADQEYHGVRIRLTAHLGQARVPVQIDVGFGDAVTPPPKVAAYPTALDQAPPRVLAYSRETVVAEKLEALVAHGPRNSRMKDFYDLHSLALRFDFAGPVLAAAMAATFARRKTPIPDGVPFGLSDEFEALPERAAQWRAFVRRGRLRDGATLRDLLSALRGFLVPVLDAVRARAGFDRAWPAGGPWR